jgi:RNA polymerase sigma-70 factor (ECF subfamily)
MEQVDEERMIAMCRQGDLAGYRMVYDRYGGPLLRTALRMLGRLQEAEDAVQETFLRLFRGIKAFRSGARFSTYLFQILTNTCIDTLRKRKPGDAPGVFDPEVESLAAPSSHELSHTLAEAVASLPGQMRASFVLYAVEEFTQAEVAGMLGISEGAVKTHVFRARRKLREWLAARPEGGKS